MSRSRQRTFEIILDSEAVGVHNEIRGAVAPPVLAHTRARIARARTHAPGARALCARAGLGA
jgi:hypothetical protein